MKYKWCAFDVEGEQGKENVKGVSIYSDTIQLYTSDPKYGIEVLRRLALQGYSFIAHNAEYDISVLLWTFGEDARITYRSGKFNHAVWHYSDDDRTAQIWDTLGLSGQLALWKVGKAIGYPKLKTPQSLTGKDPDKYEWKCEKHDTWECVECYALRDAEIVYRYMLTYEDFLKAYEVTPKKTIGSAAMGLWRSIDKPDECHLPSVHKSQENAYLDGVGLTRDEIEGSPLSHFCRQAYYGGRVEVYKIGQFQTLYSADVHSMYPSVMLATPMPDTRSLNICLDRSPGTDVLRYEGISECTVFVPTMYVPPLPCVYAGRLYFPIGTIHGTWTHLELRNAISLGCEIVHMDRSVFTSRTLSPFTGFINTLYQTRLAYKQAKDARELTVKIMLNSLYGRLGLREVQQYEEEFLMPSGTDFRDWQGYSPSYVDKYVYLSREQSRKVSSPYANVMWAAYITSAARLKLLQYQQLQGAGLVYSDTDSILSLIPIVGLGEGLGELELEGEYQSGVIVAPKVYKLNPYEGDPKLRVKGVPAAYAEQYMKGLRVNYKSPVRPREARRLHIAAGTWIECHRQMQTIPGKRHQLSLIGGTSGIDWSDTAPIPFVSDGITVSEDT